MYYRKKTFKKKKSPVGTDFQSFASPEAFTLPSQYADYGLTVDLYTIYHAYTNVNKKYIYEFTSEIDTLTLPAATGVSYRWAETIGGVEYITDFASGVAFTAGSTNRYVIVNSTAATFTAVNSMTIPIGNVWIYLGNKITEFNTYYNSYVKYIFSQDITSLTTIAYQNCDFANSLEGTLVIPPHLTLVNNYAFRSTDKITKVVMYENITALNYSCFWLAPIGRHYYLYGNAPTTAEYTFQDSQAILHIKAGATGYDVFPWNDPTYFSQIIYDL